MESSDSNLPENYKGEKKDYSMWVITIIVIVVIFGSWLYTSYFFRGWPEAVIKDFQKLQQHFL